MSDQKDQKRLDAFFYPPCSTCGISPGYKERLLQQQPYLGLWQALCSRVSNWSPDLPLYKNDLERWLVELWHEQPDLKEAFSQNTTRYDRPLGETVE
jgi:hypothetical protein